MALSTQVVVEYAYIKFTHPYNHTEFVPISEIVASAGSIHLEGKRTRTPYKPSHLEDFSTTELYVLKTSHRSTDGRSHPYHCVIGRLGVSKEELELDVQKKRVKFPVLPQHLGEADSSCAEGAAPSKSLSKEGLDVFEEQRNHTKEGNNLKNRNHTTQLANLLAASNQKLTETNTIELQRENANLKAELKRREKEVQEYSKKLKESQTADSMLKETGGATVSSILETMRPFLKAVIESAMKDAKETLATTIDDKVDKKITERLGLNNGHSEFLVSHGSYVQTWVNSINEMV